MPTKSARLNQETQGTVYGEGHRTMVTLPVGSEIAIVGQVPGHPEMMEVNWGGQSVWLFAIDFETRTKLQAPACERPLLASATSVGASTPEPEAQILLNQAKVPDTEKQGALTPRIRRFNAAGRELF